MGMVKGNSLRCLVCVNGADGARWQWGWGDGMALEKAPISYLTTGYSGGAAVAEEPGRCN